MRLSKNRALGETNSALVAQIGKTVKDELMDMENYMEYDDDDLAANDIVHGDLTINSAWNELDLDAFKTVPSDAIGFWAQVTIKDANINMSIRFRATSQANIYQRSQISTQVANQEMQAPLPIPLDSDHKFDYLVSTGMDAVAIVVLWWIRAHT